MNYEINFLILQSKTIDLPSLRQKVKEIIESLGGKITEEKEYAKRKLAYRIKKEGYGFHTVFRFTLEKKDKIKDLKKFLNLEEKIARYLIVKADELLPLKELEEKLKKASEEKTKLSQEELNKILQDKDEKYKGKSLEKIEKAEDSQKPIFNQTVSSQKPSEKIISEKEPSVKKKSESKKTAENSQKEQTERESEKKEDLPKKKIIKEEKLSMEELDKKLDEILNI